MLTGDKRETAISIAYSCTIFTESTKLLELEVAVDESTLQQLSDSVDKAPSDEQSKHHYALIANGDVRFSFIY